MYFTQQIQDRASRGLMTEKELAAMYAACDRLFAESQRVRAKKERDRRGVDRVTRATCKYAEGLARHLGVPWPTSGIEASLPAGDRAL